ncbi:MAG: TIGR04282 family arsenosugar biosynthesis glycosyltransferase [Qipengyuania sp.]
MTWPTLTIFARWPEPGQVKTRLIPALGAEGAAALYRRMLRETVREARDSGLSVSLRTTGAEPERFSQLLGGEFAIEDQGEGDLGARMARVAPPAILVGSDCPELTAALIRRAAGALERAPAVIGPAHDGGYYLLGLARPMPFLFHAMEWSTGGVFEEAMRRFERHGVAPVVLPRLRDIDTPDDLAACPHLAP